MNYGYYSADNPLFLVTKTTIWLTGKQYTLIAAVCYGISFLVALATLSSGGGVLGAIILFVTTSFIVSTPLFGLIVAIWMIIKSIKKSSNSDT